jgi:hypothetical protein
LIALSGVFACRGERVEPRGKLDGAVAVEARFERKMGSKLDYYETIRLYVTAQGKTIPLESGCPAQAHPPLAGDGTAARFAYRCAPGEPWNPVYVTRDHVFRSANAGLGAGEVPAWAAVPKDFAGAAPDALRFVDGHWDEGVHRAIFADVATLPDDARIAFLVASVDAPLSSTDWRALSDKLPPPAKKSLATALAPELAKSGVERDGFCNTVELLDAGDPSLRANAAARLTDIIAVPQALRCPPAAAKLLRIELAADRAQAAADACKLVARSDLLVQLGQYRMPSPYSDVVIDTLAATKTKCPAVIDVVRKEECDPFLAGTTVADAAKALAATRAIVESGTETSAVDHAQSERTLRALMALAYDAGAKPGAFGKACKPATSPSATGSAR